jgi:hypothetical protein
MSYARRCQCVTSSPGGLTSEPCTRPVTQEDMLCDVCRDRCSSMRISPVAGTSGPTLDFTHVKVEGFNIDRRNRTAQ